MGMEDENEGMGDADDGEGGVGGRASGIDDEALPFLVLLFLVGVFNSLNSPLFGVDLVTL